MQDLDGRIKSVYTLASEFLRKLIRKPYFQFVNESQKVELNANLIFLAMQASAIVWQYIPLIKVDSDTGGELFSIIEIRDNSMVSFTGLLNDKGDYKLGKVVKEAIKKKSAERSEFDKEVLKVDERFIIL